MLCAEVLVVADTTHEWGDDANLAGDAPNTQLQCTASVFWAVQSQHQQLSSGLDDRIPVGRAHAVAAKTTRYKTPT